MNGNPMQARCGAHCRTTGNPCQNFPMPNGRCRMHGGKSTGRPQKHGFYTQEAVSQRQQLKELILEINSLSEALGESQVGCWHESLGVAT
ncbi:HGGxSTG domain-containing protein [Limnohabitans sp. DCL3]|uniref:HGGxSTG domain-containing protein n=1 Tax=Limnohabitans sp. DCL3 TaxID=3374103 RepID=UPI003A86D964